MQTKILKFNVEILVNIDTYRVPSATQEEIDASYDDITDEIVADIESAILEFGDRGVFSIGEYSIGETLKEKRKNLDGI